MAVHRMLLGAIVLLLFVIVIPAGATVHAAQDGLPCDVETVPEDDLASAALGLTRQELDSVYGPGNAVQTGWLYEFDEFDLTLANCDLVLSIDPDGSLRIPMPPAVWCGHSCRRMRCWPEPGSSARCKARPGCRRVGQRRSRGAVPVAGRTADRIGTGPLYLRRRCLQSRLHRPHRAASGGDSGVASATSDIQSASSEDLMPLTTNALGHRSRPHSPIPGGDRRGLGWFRGRRNRRRAV